MTNVLRICVLKWRELSRQSSYVVGTLLFPSLFFLFFARSNAQEVAAAQLLLGSFSAYALLGVLFFQFGVDLANEKENPWFRYQDSLPIRPWEIFAGRVLAAMIFVLATELLLLLVVKLSTPLEIVVPTYLQLLAILFVAGVPFALLAASIGKLCRAKSALPIANLIYLSLSYVGGLWIPVNALPESIQSISRWLPSRFLGDMVWHVCVDRPFESRSLYGFLLWSLAFLALYLGIIRFSNQKVRL